MTMQIPDDFCWNGKDDWELLGIQPRLLFDPAAYGIPVGSDRLTACYRGYYCRFKVEQEQLKLDRLTVFAVEGIEQPPFNGIRPQHVKKPFLFYQYLDLEFSLPYSGTVWLGQAPEAARGGGMHEIVDYREMHALVFERGMLIRTEDYSELLADIRAQTDMSSIEKVIMACELTLPREERLQYEFR
ncbi:hypothetical protein CDO73_13340 [Saccharibacillus sp. O23]|uniref:hypothetical protein n=1 Tax=Saccharibacillus sp. O23 TaxID=2009338 RepID=UPI000B4E1D8B|nr:hypothetical protein [Saccharibacillus sp. O23]OWR30050.1 hypothetical protein CDO73_13340 [Saccharibacillus sp. O23]